MIILLTPHITGGEKLMTGDLSVPTDNMNDYRGYPSLALDKKIRSTDSSGSFSKIMKKLSLTSHD